MATNSELKRGLAEISSHFSASTSNKNKINESFPDSPERHSNSTNSSMKKNDDDKSSKYNEYLKSREIELANSRRECEILKESLNRINDIKSLSDDDLRNERTVTNDQYLPQIQGSSKKTENDKKLLINYDSSTAFRSPESIPMQGNQSMRWLGNNLPTMPTSTAKDLPMPRLTSNSVNDSQLGHNMTSLMSPSNLPVSNIMPSYEETHQNRLLSTVNALKIIGFEVRRLRESMQKRRLQMQQLQDNVSLFM